MKTTSFIRGRYPALLAYMCYVLLAVCMLQACSNNTSTPTDTASSSTSVRKTGVLLVNHGSHSETWRNTLLALETNIRDSVLKNKNISDIKTAFMEYTEPSIATQLKEFDREGYTDVILVPVFLTVSTHSFDDIPTIIGQKEDPQSVEALRVEKIERYTPQAAVHITPLLDFTDILQKNVLRRFQSLSTDPANEGLVMIAYGDETYAREWSNLLDDVGAYVSQQTGITQFSSGWCGHLVRYNPDSTTNAIRRVLTTKASAVVIPVLVATDEYFQVQIIGDGIAKIKKEEGNVWYKPDAILPDARVEQWVIDIISENIQKITGNTTTSHSYADN